jgi:hypothetical protein
VRIGDRPSRSTACEDGGYHHNGEVRRSWKLLAAKAVPDRVPLNCRI